MKQGWSERARRVALIGGLAMCCAAWVAPAVPAHAASKDKTGLHQFTGTVTSLDRATITVEKGGKQPRTVVFTRHAEMKSQGDVGKNVRVTVYYRDEDGKPTAHRVVVKPPRARAANGGR